MWQLIKERSFKKVEDDLVNDKETELSEGNPLMGGYYTYKYVKDGETCYKKL